jgi:trehalose 6-phosphate phosphatase
MKHLFTSEGEAALTALMQQRPLLAFDFDGTLAPIVLRPGWARIPTAVAARLATLATRLPVAVVSGRAVADLRGRLGFEPQHVIGSHGAEDETDPAGTAARVGALEPLRRWLAGHAAEMAAIGVVVEDKRQSIALHFRLSREPARALALIEALLAASPIPLDTVAGKMVVNATAQGAPGKAHAVHALVARSGTTCALFVGDDDNDEPVFASAPPSWLTVRVGRDDVTSRARFFLDSPSEMALLLERVLANLPPPPPH